MWLTGPKACRLQVLQHISSEVVVHGLRCSSACGIFPDQGSNPCPLHCRWIIIHCTIREVPYILFYVCCASSRTHIPQNTRVGCHFLLQGIFLTQGSNWCLLYLLMGSLPLVQPGTPPRKVHGGVYSSGWPGLQPAGFSASSPELIRVVAAVFLAQHFC